MPNPEHIPKPVRELLAYQWRGIDAAFAEAIAGYENGGRRAVPAYYYLRPDGATGGAFTHAEGVALAKAGAFGIGHVRRGNVLLVNEHASHSLDCFLTECCEAWARHQDRLRRLVVPVPEREHIRP